jgi:hypothetical protein
MKEQKWMAGLVATAAMAAINTAPDCHAQSVDTLLDKLVDKGVLTANEAQELRDESDKDFTRAYSAKSGMPEWVTSLKFNGDFRGRYEGFFSENPAFEERNRFRYRLRAGFTALMLDDIEAGFRLGSGDLDRASGITSGLDPISNNQSFQNNAAKKGIFLDLAYGKWSPIHSYGWSGSLTVGKMENPFVFSDMVFDTDYTPEGAAQQLGYQFSENHGLKLNLSEFVLDELSATSDDPWLFGSQLRLESIWSPHLSSSVGVSCLSIQHPEQLTSSSVPDINVGNTRAATRNANGTYTLGAPVNDFHPVVLDAALTYNFESAPFHNGPFPVRLFGEYLNNSGADSDNTGWAAGITLGKAGKRKTWELTYRYKYLEGDAWWEELADSDSGGYYQDAGPVAPAPAATTLRAPGSGYGSGTNIKGHVIKAGYSPFEQVTLNLTWLGLELIEPYLPGSESHMNRIQADVVLKF